ncbi:MAG: hypothetical protein K2F59_06265 [Eubacteriales bacterium]|nr:hypothetical protein [Eubacteriales bacterium]
MKKETLNKNSERVLNILTIFELLKDVKDDDVEMIKNVTVGVVLAQ